MSTDNLRTFLPNEAIDNNPLFAAMIAKPLDQGHRCVYVDWVEENYGDSDFIEGWCAQMRNYNDATWVGIEADWLMWGPLLFPESIQSVAVTDKMVDEYRHRDMINPDIQHVLVGINYSEYGASEKITQFSSLIKRQFNELAISSLSNLLREITQKFRIRRPFACERVNNSLLDGVRFTCNRNDYDPVSEQMLLLMQFLYSKVKETVSVAYKWWADSLQAISCRAAVGLQDDYYMVRECEPNYPFAFVSHAMFPTKIEAKKGKVFNAIMYRRTIPWSGVDNLIYVSPYVPPVDNDTQFAVVNSWGPSPETHDGYTHALSLRNTQPGLWQFNNLLVSEFVARDADDDNEPETLQDLARRSVDVDVDQIMNG